MSYLHTSDRIDAHARQAWALSELLIDHYSEDHNTLSDEVMSALAENLSHHLECIREINAEQEVQS